METEKIIRLSVRNLVEFILKEGDIDNRISGTLDKDAMLMGGRLHRKDPAYDGLKLSGRSFLKTAASV